MKPSIPQGTRDFDAGTIRKRKYILDTIRHVFELYGFEPLETPSFENLETLTGKYGEEGDKLVFKILNNGLDNPLKRDEIQKSFDEILVGKSKKNITERALRYDLTIPFARYVAMNSGKLTMPFKRYQIQPVWRADRPQKGRYREFYQCDADIAGSNSLLSDVEFAEIYINVFSRLRLNVEIKVNSRKILSALTEICGGENMTTIATAIDKLDKIGIEKVAEELKVNGLNSNQISIIKNYLEISGTNEEKLHAAKQLFQNTDIGKQGLKELEVLLAYIKGNDNNLQDTLTIDFTLARGLNYYTGVIYEVKARNVEMGSIGGGGRYDDLTGLFGLPDVPGIGISFGVDRIYDVMEELNLFPQDINKSTTALFLNLGEKESKFAFLEMQKLRNAEISCELFYEHTKLDKQFRYATKKNIRFAIIIGDKEIEERVCLVKNLASGEQQMIPLADLTSFFNK
ncbi:MAG: histidine--tRNA ligase [Ginsengibacter sp.]